MKKFLSVMAIVPMLIGAGCAGGSSSGGAGTGAEATAKVSAVTVVAWSMDGTCAKMYVSGPASKSIGYPNGATDKICASPATLTKIQGGDASKIRGTAKVTLGNVVKTADNVYEVDILTVTDVK